MVSRYFYVCGACTSYNIHTYMYRHNVHIINSYNIHTHLYNIHAYTHVTYLQHMCIHASLCTFIQHCIIHSYNIHTNIQHTLYVYTYHTHTHTQQYLDMFLLRFDFSTKGVFLRCMKGVFLGDKSDFRSLFSEGPDSPCPGPSPVGPRKNESVSSTNGVLNVSHQNV